MARSTTLETVAYSWNELTLDDATGITFQNLTGATVWVQATASGEPTSIEGSVKYGPDQGELNASLTDLFPGVSSPARVWLWTNNGGPVYASHD